MKTPFLPKDARCDASSINGSPEAKEEIFRGRYSYIVVITLIVTAKCYVYQLWLSLCSFFFQQDKETIIFECSCKRRFSKSWSHAMSRVLGWGLL